MKVGIGYENSNDFHTAGVNVATQACKMGNIDKPTFALAFCHGDVDAEEFLSGIQQVIGTAVPVVGGSAVGVVTGEALSYEGHPVGLVLFEDSTLDVQMEYVEGIDVDMEQAGVNLAKKLDTKPGDTIFIIYDTVHTPPSEFSPPNINSSTPLLKGIYQEIDDAVQIIGAGTYANYDFSSTIQFCGSSVKKQSAVALRLRGGPTISCRTTHGCSPKDGIYHTITRVEGAILMELDNRPAVEVINEIYQSERWQEQFPVKRLSLGVNSGDKFSLDLKESDYLNRLIVGPTPDKTGVLMFESDFEVGDEVLFMIRDNKLMIDSARENSIEALKEIESTNEEVLFGLYIDCAGRSAMFSESLEEEADSVRNLYNEQNIPLFGFYSGVEIAPVNGKSRGLDWTGVLVNFSK